MISHFKEEAKKWDRKDRIEMAAAIWKCMSENMVFNKSMQAADIGAGTGLLSVPLAKNTAHVTAVDSSQEMLEMLKGKTTENKINNIDTLLLDVDKARLTLSGLGAIISSMSLHHMEDTHGFFQKVYDALLPGGVIGIADLDMEDGGFHKNPGEMGVKHFGFERESLKKATALAGFREIKFYTAAKIPRPHADGSTSKYSVFLMTAVKK